MADSGSAGGRGGDREETVVALEEVVEDVDVVEDGDEVEDEDKQRAKSGFQSLSWVGWSRI